jgi:DNA segregation ATPase FtsK/SpoIIIE-like protein
MKIISGKNRQVASSQVASFEVIKTKSTKKTSSIVGRGIVGNLILGPIGAIAGIVTAKNNDSHTLGVTFENGDYSIVEMNEAEYLAFLTGMNRKKQTSSFKKEESSADDILYQFALDVINKRKSVDISFIQRELRIGYNKAEEIIKRLEDEGYISKSDWAGKRTVI